MPKVDVIIPTHNRAEFLHTAITSVLNQTFQDFEIIIVDDASKDHTREVIANFNDARIKVIHNQVSKGAAGSRNTAITNSYSDYIAFLDDDDEWLPEKLQMQISVLENSPQKVGGVHTGDFGVDKSTGRILNVSLPKKRGDIFQDILVGNFIVTSSLILRRTCFVKVGLFDERMPTSSDYDMWVRIAKYFHFEYIERPLVKYAIHQDKLTNNRKLAIKGKELIIEKYGQLFLLNRKSFAQRYLSLGELYCYDGNIKNGRDAFLKGMQLYPFDMRLYFNFCLSLLGVEKYKRLRRVITKLLSPLRERKTSSELQQFGSKWLSECS